MKRALPLLAAGAFILLFAPAAFAADTPDRVAVVETQAVDSVSKEDAAVASAAIAKEVAKHSGYTVVAADEVKAAFGAGGQPKDCATDKACVKNVAKKTKADFVVFSTVEPSDKKFKVTVTLVDSEKPGTPETTSETMRKLSSLDLNVPPCLDRLFKWEKGAEKPAEAAAEKPAAPPAVAAAEKPADPPPAAAPAEPAKPAPAANPPPPSAPLKKNSVAVMDTVAHDVSLDLAAQVTQTIASYCTNDLKMDVIAKDDVKRLVSFQQLQQLTGCETGTCSHAADIGTALGTERIVTSTLGKIGDRYQLSIVAMDVATSKTIGRKTIELRSQEELAENTRDLVHFALLGVPRESKGYLRITIDQPGAKIALDGAPYGASPLATPVRLLAGKHTVHVELKDFLPFDTTETVEIGKETAVEAKLIPKKSITVAGVGFLPWAGATGGVAIVGGTLSILSYYKALGICQQWDLDSKHCSVAGKAPAAATLSQLTSAENQVTLYGNQLAFYGGIASGVIGAASIALFTTYFIVGAAGAGGDEPPANAPSHVKFEPALDGFTLHF